MEDPILRLMVRYGVDPQLAQIALACARMAQVIAYGEEPPPDPSGNGVAPAPDMEAKEEARG